MKKAKLNLEELRLWEVDLESISLSKFENLKSLAIISYENLGQAFLEKVSENLEELSLIKNLSKFTNLKSLSIDSCQNVDRILKEDSTYKGKNTFTLKGRQLNHLKCFKYWPGGSQGKKDFIERVECVLGGKGYDK